MKKTGFSTKTLINVELKIDDVEDSDDEIDSYEEQPITNFW